LEWQCFPTALFSLLSGSVGVCIPKIHQQIAQELGVREKQVDAAVTLLDCGATVPFIVLG
jgi:hypothetical protein